MRPASKDGKSEQILSIAAQSQWNQKLYNEMMRDLVIYGTTTPYIYKKVSLWERLKWRIQRYAERTRDAWLVLIGKADIYDGQDD